MTLLQAFLGLRGEWQVETLLRLFLQLTAIGIVAVIAGRLLREAGRASRAALFITVLTVALALPVANLALPRFQLPVPVVGPLVRLDNPVHLGPVGAMVADQLRLDLARTIPATTTTPGARPSLLSRSVLIWLAVAALLLLRAVAISIGIRRRIATLSTITDVRRARLEAIARSLNVGVAVRLVECPECAAPYTIGTRHPVIVVPMSSAAWTVDQWHAAMVHELSHVRRADWLVLLAWQLGCAVYWFHPLLWWASRRHRLEAELACDRAVLRHGTEHTAYAAFLVQLARNARGGRRVALVSGLSGGSDLHTRVHQILHAPTVVGWGGPRRALMVLVIAALPLLLGVAPVLGSCATLSTP